MRSKWESYSHTSHDFIRDNRESARCREHAKHDPIVRWGPRYQKNEKKNASNKTEGTHRARDGEDRAQGIINIPRTHNERLRDAVCLFSDGSSPGPRLVGRSYLSLVRAPRPPAAFPLLSTSPFPFLL
jgi:hypothetical protein